MCLCVGSVPRAWRFVVASSHAHTNSAPRTHLANNAQGHMRLLECEKQDLANGVARTQALMADLRADLGTAQREYGAANSTLAGLASR